MRRLLFTTVTALLACAAQPVAPQTRAAPSSQASSRRAAIAQAFAVIEGDVNAYAEAEQALIDVYRADPSDTTTVRTLARLLNVRLTSNDFSRAGLQAELYTALLRRAAGGAPGELNALPQETFAFYCFATIANAADQAYRGQGLRALTTVRRLERDLDARRETHPDEIETHAMAGNYWLNLTAVLPVGKARRLDRAIDALTIQQSRWAEQDVLTQGLGFAPGARAVFAVWLAELLVADDRVAEARPHFERVAVLGRAHNATPAMQSLAAHAEQRLTASIAGTIVAAALPPWPRQASSCVACHSQTHAL